MQARVENLLSAVRQSRGVSASSLAGKVGVSRQTIYAIEAGTYIPNTEVTLRIARELEVKVEDIFTLPDGRLRSSESLAAEVLSAQPVMAGQAVQVCHVGERFFSVPVNAAPSYLPEADGVIARRPRTATLFSPDTDFHKRLLLAGCDPAASLLSRMVEKIGGVEIVSAAASSKLALQWLKEDKIHIAGSHLEDAATGHFNSPYLKTAFPGEDLSVITFARWEQGLVVERGNPKAIRRMEDLAKKGVRFVNREIGSGSRALLDRLLKDAAVPHTKVRGYARVAYGHLAVAFLVLSGEADCCLATRSAAQAFGLGFVPLHSERYDLVMRRKTRELPAAEAFVDVLQRATLRRKLEVLAGYDTSQTGTIVVP